LRQHRQLDSYLEQWLAAYQTTGRKIHCQAGCSGCCSLAVHATFPEALTIARQLSPDQAERLSEYIQRLKQILPNLSEVQGYLKAHRQRIGPCPFLDRQDRCSIYPARPLSCRALLSTRPAEWCRVDFSTLDPWDRQAYESGLDRETVAWPTHYVAATQDFGRRLEQELLESMRQERGWALSGNLGAMVWLARNHRSHERPPPTSQEMTALRKQEGFDRTFLLELTTSL